MNLKQLASLRALCRDDAAFEQLQRILIEGEHLPYPETAQTEELTRIADRERGIVRLIGQLGRSIINQIQRSPDFYTTLQYTLDEVRCFLSADRVAVYRFNPDWSGEFIAESKAEGWLSLVDEQFKDERLRQNISNCSLTITSKQHKTADTHLRETQGGRFKDGNPFAAVADIHQTDLSDCYLNMLQHFQVRAYVVTPIFMGETLWGLLAAYQNAQPRQWEESEIALLIQIGTQLGAALQLAASLQENHLQAERRRITDRVISRIRQPLSIEELLTTTTEEVCNLLAADRVAVFRFNPDWSGEFIAEFVKPGWAKLVDPTVQKVWEDTFLQETQGGRYRNQETFLVEDIYTIGHQSCHIELLEQFQARAYAIAPIFVGQTLWGLLATYQNSAPRQWQPGDVELLVQVADQFGLAVQQAALLAELQIEVAERRQAEESIRELNRELQLSNLELNTVNQELEAFSYSVSHDLRAPLRSIDGFSQALLEDYLPQLDAIGQDYLNRIRAATQRMGYLIDDLLNLSRVMRSEMRYETIDLSDLAQTILAELQQHDPDRQVEVTIQDGLVAKGDSHLLRILLTNLLQNAWKFTSKTAQPHITLSGETQTDSARVYIVRDNGAGFDMAYANKLFTAFQRLHQATEFAGNGIGLATVQRIVHRHGGRVWAEGTVGHGATFYFTLGNAGARS